MASHITALRAFLLADPPCNAITDGRIFGGRLPAAESAAMPRRAIVVTKAGGTDLFAGGYVEHATARVDVRSYGETPFEAERVNRAIVLALKRLRRSVHAGVLLHWANSAGGAIPTTEPGTEWPLETQAFQIAYALNEVSGS
ncbi:MAG: DUF3168 domain-containing protein [Pseudomonadota bacterium]